MASPPEALEPTSSITWDFAEYPTSNLGNVATQPASELCRECLLAASGSSEARVPFNRRKRKDSGYRHKRFDKFPDFPYLKKTADAGCQLCRLLRETMMRTSDLKLSQARSTNKDDLRSVQEFSEIDHRVPVWCLMRFHFAEIHPILARLRRDARSWSHNGISELSVEFHQASDKKANNRSIPSIGGSLCFLVLDSSHPLVKAGRRRLLSAETLSPRNISMMLEWIHECETTHNECREDKSPCLSIGGKQSGQLPTRLIFVGSRPEDIIHLVESSDFAREDALEHIRPQYAALSHMWGTATSRRMTAQRANYDALRESISLHDLPATFKDAVLVCRALGLLYLWIDSLCIIQDDEDDWNREATLMHRVYRMAHVTIVATSARSSNDGFLARDLRQAAAIKAKHPFSQHAGPNGKEDSIILTHVGSKLDYFFLENVDASAWNTRGWTLQERLLSVRSLHFCRNRIFYECSACRKSEDVDSLSRHSLSGNSSVDSGQPLLQRIKPRPLLRPNSDEEQDEWLRLHRLPSMEKIGPEHLGPEELQDRDAWFKRWLAILQQYVSRDLTHDTDKLIAIQSVAEAIAPHYGDAYLPWAGVWSPYRLPEQLLWSAGGSISAARKLANSAPSWSWASLEASIVFWEEHAPEEKKRRASTVLQPRISCQAPDTLYIRAFTRKIQAVTSSGIRTMRQYFSGLTGDDDSGRVFADALFDLHGVPTGESGDQEMVYVHLIDEGVVTGLVLQAAEERDGKAAWRRVGVAGMVRDSEGVHGPIGGLDDNIFTYQELVVH